MNSVVKGYYNDTHFKGHQGIDLLPSTSFTDANKSFYIDSFAVRRMDCEQFVYGLYDDKKDGNQTGIYQSENRGVDDFCTSFCSPKATDLLLSYIV